MRIISFFAENVKRLKIVSITPKGDVVQITGPNGSGKSSVLDAIFYALAGKSGIPSKVVRDGCEQAVVKLELGELTVTREFSGDETTKLIVQDGDGRSFPSPQKMLDSLVGSLSFDPLAFTRMDAKRQLETLKGVVKLKADIDAIEGSIKFAYEKRTEVNREVMRLQNQVFAMKLPEVLPEAIDVTKLLREMEASAQKNSETAKVKAEIQLVTIRIQAIHKQIETLQQELSKAADRRNQLGLLVKEEIDLSEIRKRIQKGREVQEIIDKVETRKSLQSDLKKQQKESERLTGIIESKTQEKQDAITSAKMPVKGLSFGNGEVLFNKLPFNQASQAEQLRVSVGIAMAANPELRVLRIQDGSLLDKNSMGILAEMAGDHDYQLWIECVAANPAVPAQIVMEDGEVKAVRK